MRKGRNMLAALIAGTLVVSGVPSAQIFAQDVSDPAGSTETVLETADVASTTDSGESGEEASGTDVGTGEAVSDKNEDSDSSLYPEDWDEEDPLNARLMHSLWAVRRNLR